MHVEAVENCRHSAIFIRLSFLLPLHRYFNIHLEKCYIRFSFIIQNLKIWSYFSTRFGGLVPRSGSEQQLPRAETHSDFGRHSLLRSSLKASAATGGKSFFLFFKSYQNIPYVNKLRVCLNMDFIFQRQV